MSTGTGIEWTQATWNPVTGCTRVSAGCDNCYAVQMTHRLESMGQVEKYGGLTVLNNRGDRHFNGKVRTHEDALAIPLKRRTPTVYFVNSMSDLFHRDVPFDFIDRCFAVMALCPQHTFQILTKRPERMAEYFNDRCWLRISLDEAETIRTSQTWASDRQIDNWRLRISELRRHVGPLPNVWLGTSCENQEAADQRIPHLLKCPAAVRFLSCEPLLGEIDLLIDGECSDWACGQCGSRNVDTEVSVGPGDVSTYECHDCKYLGTGEDADWTSLIHWVIAGGESGGDARPCNVRWIRSIVEQCKAAGVPCFVKQLGKWIAGPHEFDGWKGVIDRWLLDAGDGGTSVWHRPILRSEFNPKLYDERPLNAVAWGLNDPKGGEPSEWPADLRVREMPEARR